MIKNIARKVTIVLGTVAVTVGMMGATTVAADAHPAKKHDSSWGR